MMEEKMQGKKLVLAMLSHLGERFRQVGWHWEEDLAQEVHAYAVSLQQELEKEVGAQLGLQASKESLWSKQSAYRASCERQGDQDGIAIEKGVLDSVERPWVVLAGLPGVKRLSWESRDALQEVHEAGVDVAVQQRLLEGFYVAYDRALESYKASLSPFIALVEQKWEEVSTELDEVKSMHSMDFELAFMENTDFWVNVMHRFDTQDESAVDQWKIREALGNGMPESVLSGLSTEQCMLLLGVGADCFRRVWCCHEALDAVTQCVEFPITMSHEAWRLAYSVGSRLEDDSWDVGVEKGSVNELTFSLRFVESMGEGTRVFVSTKKRPVKQKKEGRHVIAISRLLNSIEQCLDGKILQDACQNLDASFAYYLQKYEPEIYGEFADLKQDLDSAFAEGEPMLRRVLEGQVQRFLRLKLVPTIVGIWDQRPGAAFKSHARDNRSPESKRGLRKGEPVKPIRTRRTIRKKKQESEIEVVVPQPAIPLVEELSTAMRSVDYACSQGQAPSSDAYQAARKAMALRNEECRVYVQEYSKEQLEHLLDSWFKGQDRTDHLHHFLRVLEDVACHMLAVEYPIWCRQHRLQPSDEHRKVLIKKMVYLMWEHEVDRGSCPWSEFYDSCEMHFITGSALQDDPAFSSWERDRRGMFESIAQYIQSRVLPLFFQEMELENREVELESDMKIDELSGLSDFEEQERAVKDGVAKKKQVLKTYFSGKIKGEVKRSSRGLVKHRSAGSEARGKKGESAGSGKSGKHQASDEHQGSGRKFGH